MLKFAQLLWLLCDAPMTTSTVLVLFLLLILGVNGWLAIFGLKSLYSLRRSTQTDVESTIASQERATRIKKGGKSLLFSQVFWLIATFTVTLSPQERESMNYVAGIGAILVIVAVYLILKARGELAKAKNLLGERSKRSLMIIQLRNDKANLSIWVAPPNMSKDGNASIYVTCDGVSVPVKELVGTNDSDTANVVDKTDQLLSSLVAPLLKSAESAALAQIGQGTASNEGESKGNTLQQLGKLRETFNRAGDKN